MTVVDQKEFDFLSSVGTILGFGFIGLSFLMALLGYKVLTSVINAPTPQENVVRLARLYMFISLALLVFAGPLHFGLLWAQSTFNKPNISIKLSLANPTWKPALFGEVGILKGGQFVALSPSQALSESFAEGSDIIVQLENVMEAIRKLQAQALASTPAFRPSAVNVPVGSPAETAADVAITGG